MPSSSFIRRLVAMAAVGGSCLLSAAAAAGHPRAAYVPREVVVGYSAPPSAAVAADVASRAGARTSASATGSPTVGVLKLSRGESVWAVIRRLRRLGTVVYAEPNYIAREAGGWIPDDHGRARRNTDWRLLQWNFLPGSGVDAPDAWSNLMRDAAGGGRGVTVAILDTGVAYRNWGDFRASPDFAGTRFAGECDLVAGSITGLSRAGQITSASRCTNPNALDRQGHGTFVAGVVAETTNNGIGVTGLAYGATIMPVRVLDADGNGDAATIARGIRYAATHGAKVINLSLEFDLSVGANDIPDVMNAIDFANRRGALVIAASGNDSAQQIAYPARDPQVVSVGATTRDRCLAGYSNTGSGLTLVAPGGGDDAPLADDPNCHPERNLPDIFQMTFPDPSAPTHFGLPGGWYGTSMAAPHVAAAAALVVASGVLGGNPSPAQVLSRLEETAQPLGGTVPNANYGYGLLDAGAATAGISKTARSRRHHRRVSHHRRVK